MAHSRTEKDQAVVDAPFLRPAEPFRQRETGEAERNQERVSLAASLVPCREEDPNSRLVEVIQHRGQ